MFTVSTWNVNSINMRKEQVLQLWRDLQIKNSNLVKEEEQKLIENGAKDSQNDDANEVPNTHGVEIEIRPDMTIEDLDNIENIEIDKHTGKPTDINKYDEGLGSKYGKMGVSQNTCLKISDLKRKSGVCIMLQELKCVDEKFPYAVFDDDISNIVVHGQKRYNGIAILTDQKVVCKKTTFKDNPCEDESRYLEVELANGITLISVYVPNGTGVTHENYQKKLLFLKGLRNRLKQLHYENKHVVIGGDFNVAPFDIDVYSVADMKNTLSFTMHEKVLIRQILNLGYVDFYRINSYNKKEFSWWDYRGGSVQNNHGLRIDYILGNKADNFICCEMLKKMRCLDSPSDHIPVCAVIKV
ncbi:MAG: exodeoxyribonuclease III [Pseudomonadota bacterium]